MSRSEAGGLEFFERLWRISPVYPEGSHERRSRSSLLSGYLTVMKIRTRRKNSGKIDVLVYHLETDTHKELLHYSKVGNPIKVLKEGKVDNKFSSGIV